MKALAESKWRQVATYFALVIILTVPFWFAGALAQARVLPGLSLAAFAIIVPPISAVLVASAAGRQAILSLFATLGTSGRHKPLIVLVAVMVPLAIPVVSRSIPGFGELTFPGLGIALSLIPVFFIAAIAEEIGWSAFATERVADRAGVLTAGLVVGTIWAIWHIPALVGLGRSIEWIAWWSLWTVAQRVIIALLYVRSGSWLWGPVLFHAASNTAWQAAPDAFDPRIESVIMAAIAVAAALLWWRKAS